jgi:hypothetical protein
MSEDQTRDFSRVIWRQINLPNLRAHIVGGRDVADIVIRKGAGHAVLDVAERAR